MNIVKKGLTVCLVAFCIFSTKTSLFAEELISAFKIALPVVLVSAGQSPYLNVLTSIFNNQGIPYDSSMDAWPEHLKSGVGFPNHNTCYYNSFGEKRFYSINFESQSELAEGTPFKSMILVMGLMRMGTESNPDKELIRIKEIVKWAIDNQLHIIGVYIEPRNNSNKLDDEIINIVVNSCNMIIAAKESNFDNKFTNVGEELKIPVVIVENIKELAPLFKNLFNSAEELE